MATSLVAKVRCPVCNRWLLNLSRSKTDNLSIETKCKCGHVIRVDVAAGVLGVRAERVAQPTGAVA